MRARLTSAYQTVKSNFQSIASFAMAGTLVLARTGTAVWNNTIFFEYGDDYARMLSTGLTNATHAFNATTSSNSTSLALNEDATFLSPNATFAICLASAGAVGAFGTAVVTRFFVTYRKGTSSKPPNPVPPQITEEANSRTAAAASDSKVDDVERQNLLTAQDPPDPENPQPIKTAHEPADWRQPGEHSDPRSWNVGYKFTSVVTIPIYAIGSGLSAVLSGHGLIRLLQKWMLFEFDDTCSDQTSAIWTLVLADGVIILLMSANVISFFKYNFEQLRQYFPSLFNNARLFTPEGELCSEVKYNPQTKEINYQTSPLYSEKNNNSLRALFAHDGKLYNSRGERMFTYNHPLFHKKINRNGEEEFIPVTLKKGWQLLSGKDHFQLIIGVGLGTIAIWFANQRLLLAINDTILCHMVGGRRVVTPIVISKLISGTSSVVNLQISGLMTAGAMFNKLEKSREQKATRQLMAQLQPPNGLDPAALPQPAIEQKPEFGLFGKLITPCSYLNSINMGQGMFTAFTTLPQTLFGLSKNATQHPVTVILAIGAGCITLSNQLYLDWQGREAEEKYRRDLRLAQPNVVVPVPTVPVTDPVMLQASGGAAATNGHPPIKGLVSQRGIFGVPMMNNPPPPPTAAPTASPQVLANGGPG